MPLLVFLSPFSHERNRPASSGVTADNGLLTIRGERRIEKRAEHKGFERLERVEGAFLRRFTLPEKVRAEEIKARHTNGVLEIEIPKQPLPAVRRVEVQVN